MLKRLVFSLCAVIVFSGAALAQQYAYTPGRGAPERKLILAALRASVEKELKQKVQFAVQHFKVQGDWAFVNGEPRDANGRGKPDYRGTEYQAAISGDAFDNNFFALFKRNGGKWKVVTYAIGCTDVCYIPWVDQYKAPKTIFPYTE